jgi:hypothetical protein
MRILTGVPYAWSGNVPAVARKTGEEIKTNGKFRCSITYSIKNKKKN